ncbi:MAG: dATP/dGTP diphosphohydrolase domain-containing protein [Verrucomicrobiota bacterium]
MSVEKPTKRFNGDPVKWAWVRAGDDENWNRRIFVAEAANGGALVVYQECQQGFVKGLHFRVTTYAQYLFEHPYGYDAEGKKIEPPEGYEIVPEGEEMSGPEGHFLFYSSGGWDDMLRCENWVAEVTYKEFPGIHAYARKVSPIAKGHNPDKLAVEQVGVSDGWRLWTKAEIDFIKKPTKWHAAEVFISREERWGRFYGFTFREAETYRTDKPEGYFLPQEPAKPETREAFAKITLTAEPGANVDPKKSAGDAKTPMHLLSPAFLEETANAAQSGALKYGPYNWRTSCARVDLTTYTAAVMRHINAVNGGEDIDPESGLSHWAHISATCNIILDCIANDLVSDDRVKVARPEAAETV